MNKELNTEFIVTAIVWFFLWYLWIHRFIHWKVWTGILMLITFWGLWVWWVVDWILIFMQKFEDKNWKIIEMYTNEYKWKLEKEF